jgi:hypothetical protein
VKRDRVLYPFLLLVLGLAFGHALWLGGGVVYSPHSDIVAYLIGAKSVFLKTLRGGEGSYPLWNPAVNCGTPAHAQPLSANFYPLHWLYLLLPLERAVNWIVLLDVLGAGLAMHLLGLRLFKERAAAFACAAGYMLCFRSLAMIHAGWFAALDMYALTPLLFWSLDRLVEIPDRRRAAELGGVLALCLLQPFVQGFYYALLGAAAFVAYRLPARRTLTALASAGVLGLLLSAPDLLARLQFMSLSTRVHFDYGFFIHLAPTWRDLKTFLDPLQTGRVEFWESNFYFGLWAYPPILYACWKKSRANRALIFSCATLLILCFDTPLLKLAYAAVPGFKLFRFHARLLLLEQLAVLVLAGRGLDAALEEKSSRAFASTWAAVSLLGLAAAALWKSPTLALSSSCLAAAALLFAVQKRVRPASIALLALLPLLDNSWRLAPVTARISDLFPDQAFYRPLKRQALNGRVVVIGRNVIPYGAAGFLDIDMANGYEPLNLKDFEEYFDVLKYGGIRARRTPVVWTDLESIAKPDMLRALDVEYIAAGAPQPLERLGFEPAGRHDDVPVFDFYEGMIRAPVYLWKDRRPLGPAYFADAVRPVASEEDSLAALASTDSVRIAHVLGLDRPAGTLDFSGGTARLTRRGYDKYAYEIASRGRNFLILSQIWYPGWKARLDGREIALYRTNHALLGCFVPPGPHALELEMTSPALRLGLLLCALGTALAAFLILTAS